MKGAGSLTTTQGYSKRRNFELGGSKFYSACMPWPTTLSMTCLLGASILSTPNAADDYRELDERWQQISEDDQNRIMPWNLPPYYTPTPQTERAIQKLAEIDAIITRGARKERCDFGLDYAQGPAMLVPHLSPMRLITEALETIVRLRRLQGEHAKAAICMDAMYAMGFQLAHDGTVISSLVGISIFRMNDDMVTEAIEAGDIGPAVGKFNWRKPCGRDCR